MQTRQSKSGAGFTILEAVIAIFVMAVGIVGVAGVITQSVAVSRSATNEAIAWYLAQEGVEIARNIRDTNMLDTVLAWDAGFNSNDCDSSKRCGADYDDAALINGRGDNPLVYDSVTGLYNYDSGSTDSPFKRHIVADNDGGDPEQIEIKVTVTWKERAVDREVQLLAELYNWEDP